ncbi:MAG: S41 family peptidase [Flavobacteriales bacterium]
MKSCLFCLSLLLLYNSLDSQVQSNSTIQNVIYTLNKYHYEPVSLDDQFSEYVFYETLSLLDPEHLIFCKEDIELLSEYKHGIDDQINENSTLFINELEHFFSLGIERQESLFESFRSLHYDLNSLDSLELVTKGHYETLEILNLQHKQLIQLEVLDRIIFEEEKAVVDLNVEEIFKSYLDQIIDYNLCELTNRFREKSINELVTQRYLNAICSAYDPHSSYFSEHGKELLTTSLSSDAMNFGFSLIPSEFGYVEVSDLTPGGAAWNSNQINEGDLLISVKGNGQFLELKCISWQYFVEFMLNSKLTEAEFQIRKKNNEELTIVLQKQPSQIESNIIKSYILETENQKLGYLYLPSFYGEVSDSGISMKGCANDVTTELIRLKKEGVNGLIFDLRDNTGGYMLEAIRLAGSFVDHGALSIVHRKGEDPVTIKDPNRGTSYSGLMLILVNGYSASASELFAAALQDQNRAIIAGSSTFGKASMQRIIPLEDPEGVIQPEEFLKISFGKFYRVDGSSHQNSGVQVDISIPSEYDLVSIKEKNYSTALSNSSIEKKTYYYPQAKLPISKLKIKSENRQKESLAFNLILKTQKTLRAEENSYKIPIGYNQLKSFYIMDDKTVNKNKSSSKPIFETKKPEHFKDIFQVNEEEDTVIMQNISSDLSIIESFLILTDFLEIN